MSNQMKFHITSQDIESLGYKVVPQGWKGTLLDFFNNTNTNDEQKIKIISNFMGEKLARLFAVYCAKEAMKDIENPDPRSIAAIKAAEKFAKGLISREDLSAAWSAARSAADSAARNPARSAAWSAAWSAAESAADSAAWSAAWSAAESAARSAARSAADSAARSTAWSAAWSAADSAARSAQKSQMKKMIQENQNLEPKTEKDFLDCFKNNFKDGV